MLPDPNLVTSLAVMRADHPSHVPARSLASLERHGTRSVLVLDDGTMLDFDAQELAAAAAACLSDDAPFWAHLRRAA